MRRRKRWGGGGVNRKWSSLSSGEQRRRWRKWRNNSSPLSVCVSSVHVKPLSSESYVSVRDVVRPLLLNFQETFTKRNTAVDIWRGKHSVSTKQEDAPHHREPKAPTLSPFSDHLFGFSCSSKSLMRTFHGSLKNNWISASLSAQTQTVT